VTADVYGCNPTGHNKMFAQWWRDIKVLSYIYFIKFVQGDRTQLR